MRPFLVIADIIDGTFAIIAVDPTKRADNGCEGVVQSIHKTRDEAEAALSKAEGR